MARFRDLWEECIVDAASRPRFKVVAVSFPDLGHDTALAVASMGAVMEKGSLARNAHEGRNGAGPEVAGVAAGAATEAQDEVAAGGRVVAGSGRALNVWQVCACVTYTDADRFFSVGCVNG